MSNVEAAVVMEPLLAKIGTSSEKLRETWAMSGIAMSEPKEAVKNM
jgi:hypothetical protein